MKPVQLALSKGRYLAIGIVFLLGLFAIVGSGEYYRSTPRTQTVENNYFAASISPLCSDSCKSFSLTIRNKTDKDIEVDWNKTLYISNGQTTGGFMFEGVVYKDRNNPKSPDMIFANGTFSKTIWPNNLVSFSGSSWYHEEMSIGDDGVYLVVKVADKEIKEKLIVNINVYSN